MADNFTNPGPSVSPSEENVVVTPANQAYSAFWPVLIVFVALLAAHASYIGTDLNERLQIKRALGELAQTMPQAARITKIAEDLGKDLVALAAANDPEAAKIVAEFNIKTNRVAVAPAAVVPPGQ